MMRKTKKAISFELAFIAWVILIKKGILTER